MALVIKPENPLIESLPKVRLRKPQGKPLVKVNDPVVADHIAKVLIKNNLDYTKAATELDKTATGTRNKNLSEKMKESPVVQKALKENLEASGLDDKSKNVYVKTLWEWMLEGKESLTEHMFKEDGSRDYKGEAKRREAALAYATTAARILSRAFIQEKQQDNKPMELRIKGWGDLVDTMTKPVGGTEEEGSEDNV